MSIISVFFCKDNLFFVFNSLLRINKVCLTALTKRKIYAIMAHNPKKQGFFNLRQLMKIYINSLSKNLIEELTQHIKSIFLLVLMLFFSFPQITISESLPQIMKGPIPRAVITTYYNGPTLPEIPARVADRTMRIVVTAYNSEPGQTDDTPFITAFGTHVRDGIVATNFLPKGALVRFPELFGDKEFVVEDRMNERYYYHMDIWMAEKAEAVKFGAKFVDMEIL